MERNNKLQSNNAAIGLMCILFILFGGVMLSFQCMSHAEIKANTKQLDATYQLLTVIKNKCDSIVAHQLLSKEKKQDFKNKHAKSLPIPIMEDRRRADTILQEEIHTKTIRGL